jgi:hypothetical protein
MRPENTDETLVIDLYNIHVHHCNICNISIYFCSVHLKHLRWRRQQRSGGADSHDKHAAGAVVVEKKASGRRGREGGVREPRRSRSQSAVAVMREFFLICGDWIGADRKNRLLDVRSINSLSWTSV